MSNAAISHTPPLGEVLLAALEARLQDVHVALPAKVVRYDPLTGQVDAKPLLKSWRADSTGSRSAVSLPVVPGVPLVFPGGGGHRATFPVAVGDMVLLVFADRSLDVWKSLGAEVDPLSFASHGLADAIAIPGLHSFSAPLTTVPLDRSTFGADVGTSRVEVLLARINLGAGASQPFVLGGQFATHMTALANALTALNAALTPLMLPPAAAAAKAAVQLAVTAATNLAADISTTVFGSP